jgi:hypothetical protein
MDDGGALSFGLDGYFLSWWIGDMSKSWYTWTQKDTSSQDREPNGLSFPLMRVSNYR